MFRPLILALAPLLCFAGSNLLPEADQRLAHDMCREIVEIKPGYTTGATAPLAEAIARQLRAAGFADGYHPDRDIMALSADEEGVDWLPNKTGGPDLSGPCETHTL